TNYENISKWSKSWKTGKVVSKVGDTTKWECEVSYFGIKFKALIIGKVKPYEAEEQVIIDDGSIIHDHLEFVEVPEGTRIDWSGDIPKLGKKVGRFGFL
ncbi:MAG: hypothetical protein Q7S37_01240, partial [bacterium]|nr:hypothetical protein [bacterium]